MLTTCIKIQVEEHPPGGGLLQGDASCRHAGHCRWKAVLQACVYWSRASSGTVWVAFRKVVQGFLFVWGLSGGTATKTVQRLQSPLQGVRRFAGSKGGFEFRKGRRLGG